MSKLLLLLACLVTLAASKSSIFFNIEDATEHFENFIKEHGKEYSSDEEKAKRFEIFKENLRRANELNQQSEHTEFGITQFSDLTHDEFIDSLTGLRSNMTVGTNLCTMITDEDVPNVPIPEPYYNWQRFNIVSRVKNQRQCGSCYSFSATGNIESQYAKKYGSMVELSEQQIVDCDIGSHGCSGGLMTSAFSSIIQMGGIEMESSYPYVAVQQHCLFKPQPAVVKLTGCYQFNLKSQLKLRQALLSFGPISIGVKSSNFHVYRGGVLKDKLCNVGNINHGILLVGYGVENGVPYWLAKNSWGETFGEQGYIKFERGDDRDSCGVMNDLMASAIVQ
ncbi:procathepsin L-like [Helicoverpa zea]|uniref:procathepsin L-like n=1 Tax=Helicoverpa zea TaxID=7113 RepID=UPI001F588FCB|nr:procathepsin L-like [Helicoverpa zea]